MPEKPLDLAALDERLAAIVRGRRVIIMSTVAAATTSAVQQLLRYGAERPLVIAHGSGLGDPPSREDARVLLHALPEQPALMSEELQAHIAFVKDLPAAVLDDVHRYDPDRSALWWLVPTVDVPQTFLGRSVLGGRRPTWAALEDKTVADQIFDAAGLARAPSRVVPAQGTQLRSAARELESGAGTVWSGDARQGINGGGEFVRWVRTVAGASHAVELFKANCDRVRVAPFLDGVPCSIHGIVLPDGVAVLRPVELLVLRGEHDRFVYSGMSTWWDPPDEDRWVMRSAARAIGNHLADRVGFRGGFSVDGVLTAHGWLPTELNPRFAGGLSTIARGLGGFPLAFLHAAVVAGFDTAVTAQGLEKALLTAADAQRNMVMHALSTAFRSDQTITDNVMLDGRSLRRPGPDEAPIGTVQVGPATMGVVVRFTPAEATMSPGRRAAPYACALLDFADAEYGTDFGSCTPAPDLR